MIDGDYVFYFRIDDGDRRQINPIYTNAHQRDEAPEGDSRYFRPSISEPFTFTRGNGYEDVQGGSIARRYYLDIYEIIDGEEVLFFPGKFTKTDCKINEDEKHIEVSLIVNDRYTEYQANLDTEYNLLDLGAERRTVSYQKYPVYQLYVLGSKYVTNIQPGNYWQRQVEPITNYQSVAFVDLFWGIQPFRVGYIPYDPAVAVDVSGYYFFAGYDNPAVPSFNRSDGAYSLRFTFGQGEFNPDTGEVDPDEPTFYSLGPYKTPDDTVGTRETQISEVLTLIAENGDVVRFYQITVYGRVLTNANSFNGQNTNVIPNGDQFAAGMSFRRVVRYDFDNVVASIATRQTNQFGRYEEGGPFPHSGQFAGAPALPVDAVFQIPLCASEWTQVGWWVRWDQNLFDLFRSAGETITIPDTLSMSSTVSSMLTEMGTPATFEPTEEHSQLFYAPANPITGRPQIEFVLVPAGNILSASYDTPVTRLPFKMKDLVDLWRFAFQAEPFIDTDGRYRIETARFFENGQTYNDGQPVVGADLRTSRDPFTKRPWTFATNVYEYDKSRLPGRLVFGWANDTSLAFDGQDIVAVSGYVDQTAKEERRTSRFVTDLQLALSQPSAFSKESVFVLACRPDDDGNLVVIEEMIPGFLSAQNGAMAWPTLHAEYYLDNMPGDELLINGDPVVARSVRRSRTQEIEAPLGPGYSPNSLVVTDLGGGLPARVSKNMISKISTTTLRHGTD